MFVELIIQLDSSVLQKLVDSLHSGRNVSTVLQSLGCIAQYSVLTFETQDEDITPYIYKNVIQVEPSDILISQSQSSGHGASGKLKSTPPVNQEMILYHTLSPNVGGHPTLAKELANWFSRNIYVPLTSGIIEFQSQNMIIESSLFHIQNFVSYGLGPLTFRWFSFPFPFRNVFIFATTLGNSLRSSDKMPEYFGGAEPSFSSVSNITICCLLSALTIENSSLRDGRGSFSKNLNSYLIVYGLKTLVKSFLPHRGSHVKRNISRLLDILSKMLHKADIFNDLISCESDEAHVRLAAAKSVLRLSRRWDLHISPEIFCSTVVMAKDSSTFVRRSFIDKTHKLLKVHLIPIRYACAFALATSDCLKDLRDDSFKYMAEFIKEYSKEARIRQNSAVQGVSITDYPAYVVVFLIHVLAHDPGFPPEDCRDKENIIQFFCPIVSLLQALVNASIVDGDMDLVHDAILHLLCILRAIKRAVDAVDAQKTTISLVKKSEEASSLGDIKFQNVELSYLSFSFMQAISDCTQFNFDQTFVERVVDAFRSCFYPPIRILPKRSQKRHEDGMQFDVIDNITSNLTACKQFNLPTSEAIKPNKKNERQETSMGCKRKRPASPIALGTVGLHNKHFTTVHNCKIGASKSCEVILEKDLRSSCDSVTIGRSHTEAQVSSQNMDGTACSLKENGGLVSIVTTEPLKSPSAKFKDPCSAKEFSAKRKALCGQQIKSVSPIDRG
ncbi:hypothetical protein JRO89_XS07G0171200 [Xanthoceras sorbifolium]|uniref:Uncharacterized protein n=1 Tax=Xanthoceras sorbifolium TaxID=99658 RepID=A0ABQ8HU50_9ROSI|nr:hypothetical protein JRO89_XS07G0171200 [Xanthoceras sorbifolium]